MPILIQYNSIEQLLHIKNELHRPAHAKFQTVFKTSAAEIQRVGYTFLTIFRILIIAYILFTKVYYQNEAYDLLYKMMSEKLEEHYHQVEELLNT